MDILKKMLGMNGETGAADKNAATNDKNSKRYVLAIFAQEYFLPS